MIEKYGDEIAVTECLDAGQALKIVRGQIARAAENFSFYAEWAEKAMDGRTFPVDREWLNYSVRVPVGVCGIITPWNAPLMLSTWRIAPALATGNTVILKPAEWSPLTAWKLAKIFRRSRSAARRFQRGPRLWRRGRRAAGVASAGSADYAHRRNHHRFIGDEECGRSNQAPVAWNWAANRRPIIFADADLERALDATVFQIYSFNGERCTANSRALIQKKSSTTSCKNWHNARKRSKWEARWIPNTEVGPLIHPEHFDRVMGYIKIGQSEGAQLLARRPARGRRGQLSAPTLFTGDNHMRIAQEEIFGPVLTAIPFNG